MLSVEIEHVDTIELAVLEKEGVQVHPAPATIALIQDKFAQKQHLETVTGVPLGEFSDIPTVESLIAAGDRWGFPLMLKTKRDAYDGRAPRDAYGAHRAYDDGRAPRDAYGANDDGQAPRLREEEAREMYEKRRGAMEEALSRHARLRARAQDAARARLGGAVSMTEQLAALSFDLERATRFLRACDLVVASH